MPTATAAIASRTFRALGTSATLLVTDTDALDPAGQGLAAELDAIDTACSRFRSDSELSRVNHARGRPVPVGALFADALNVALPDSGGLTDMGACPWAARPVSAWISRGGSPRPPAGR